MSLSQADADQARARERGGRASPDVEYRDSVRRLNLIAAVAVVDLLLLVPLLIAAATDAEGLIDVLGPLHGIGFVVQLALCVSGAISGRWGWWFPALVLVTLGPPGALLGDRYLRRALRRQFERA